MATLKNLRIPRYRMNHPEKGWVNIAKGGTVKVESEKMIASLLAQCTLIPGVNPEDGPTRLPHWELVSADETEAQNATEAKVAVRNSKAPKE